jgi:hypothetical protein|tara:strand:+ start:3329 stop:3505 length:177 start_codon:yes stop_codon:yes gene_type:complete
MTINEALKILLENSDYAQYTNADDIEWQTAFNEVTDRLGVFYDDRTNQFVTKDTGHVI